MENKDKFFSVKNVCNSVGIADEGLSFRFSSAHNIKIFSSNEFVSYFVLLLPYNIKTIHNPKFLDKL